MTSLILFRPPIELSPNAQRYLDENGDKSLPFAIHVEFVKKSEWKKENREDDDDALVVDLVV